MWMDNNREIAVHPEIEAKTAARLLSLVPAKMGIGKDSKSRRLRGSVSFHNGSSIADCLRIVLHEYANAWRHLSDVHGAKAPHLVAAVAIALSLDHRLSTL